MKAFLVTAVIAVLFIVMMAFGARNEQMVTVNYFLAKGEFSLPLLLGISFFAGFLICWFLAIPVFIKQKLLLRKLKQQSPKTNTEITPKA